MHCKSNVWRAAPAAIKCIRMGIMSIADATRVGSYTLLLWLDAAILVRDHLIDQF